MAVAQTNDGARQGSVEGVTLTAHPYDGDWHALFDGASIAPGPFDGRLLAWINAQLGTSFGNLNGAKAAYALNQGFSSWGAMGTFTPGGAPPPFSDGFLLEDGVTLIVLEDGVTYLQQET